MILISILHIFGYLHLIYSLEIKCDCGDKKSACDLFCAMLVNSSMPEANLEQIPFFTFVKPGMPNNPTIMPSQRVSSAVFRPVIDNKLEICPKYMMPSNGIPSISKFPGNQLETEKSINYNKLFPIIYTTGKNQLEKDMSSLESESCKSKILKRINNPKITEKGEILTSAVIKKAIANNLEHDLPKKFAPHEVDFCSFITWINKYQQGVLKEDIERQKAIERIKVQLFKAYNLKKIICEAKPTAIKASNFQNLVKTVIDSTRKKPMVTIYNTKDCKNKNNPFTKNITESVTFVSSTKPKKLNILRSEELPFDHISFSKQTIQKYVTPYITKFTTEYPEHKIKNIKYKESSHNKRERIQIFDDQLEDANESFYRLITTTLKSMYTPMRTYFLMEKPETVYITVTERLSQDQSIRQPRSQGLPMKNQNRENANINIKKAINFNDFAKNEFAPKTTSNLFDDDKTFTTQNISFYDEGGLKEYTKRENACLKNNENFSDIENNEAQSYKIRKNESSVNLKDSRFSGSLKELPKQKASNNSLHSSPNLSFTDSIKKVTKPPTSYLLTTPKSTDNNSKSKGVSLSILTETTSKIQTRALSTSKKTEDDFLLREIKEIKIALQNEMDERRDGNEKINNNQVKIFELQSNILALINKNFNQSRPITTTTRPLLVTTRVTNVKTTVTKTSTTTEKYTSVTTQVSTIIPLTETLHQTRDQPIVSIKEKSFIDKVIDKGREVVNKVLNKYETPTVTVVLPESTSDSKIMPPTALEYTKTCKSITKDILITLGTANTTSIISQKSNHIVTILSTFIIPETTKNSVNESELGSFSKLSSGETFVKPQNSITDCTQSMPLIESQILSGTSATVSALNNSSIWLSTTEINYIVSTKPEISTTSPSEKANYTTNLQLAYSEESKEKISTATINLKSSLLSTCSSTDLIVPGKTLSSQRLNIIDLLNQIKTSQDKIIMYNSRDDLTCNSATENTLFSSSLQNATNQEKMQDLEVLSKKFSSDIPEIFSSTASIMPKYILPCATNQEKIQNLEVLSKNVSSFTPKSFSASVNLITRGNTDKNDITSDIIECKASSFQRENSMTMSIQEPIITKTEMIPPNIKYINTEVTASMDTIAIKSLVKEEFLQLYSEISSKNKYITAETLKNIFTAEIIPSICKESIESITHSAKKMICKSNNTTESQIPKTAQNIIELQSKDDSQILDKIAKTNMYLENNEATKNLEICKPTTKSVSTIKIATGTNNSDIQVATQPKNTSVSSDKLHTESKTEIPTEIMHNERSILNSFTNMCNITTDKSLVTERATVKKRKTVVNTVFEYSKGVDIKKTI